MDIGERFESLTPGTASYSSVEELHCRMIHS